MTSKQVNPVTTFQSSFFWTLSRYTQLSQNSTLNISKMVRHFWDFRGNPIGSIKAWAWFLDCCILDYVPGKQRCSICVLWPKPSLSPMMNSMTQFSPLLLPLYLVFQCLSNRLLYLYLPCNFDTTQDSISGTSDRVTVINSSWAVSSTSMVWLAIFMLTSPQFTSMPHLSSKLHIWISICLLMICKYILWQYFNWHVSNSWIFSSKFVFPPVSCYG